MVLDIWQRTLKHLLRNALSYNLNCVFVLHMTAIMRPTLAFATDWIHLIMNIGTLFQFKFGSKFK